MTFQPDLIEALLEHADPVKAPIVGGLCFSMDNDGKLFPTLYDVIGTEECPEFVRYHEWQPESMMQVFATGAACLLIHRNALRAIRDYRNPERPGQVGFSQAFPWFQETDFYGRAMGEDITFCLRAGRAGLPVHVNTAVKLGHIKEFELTFEHFAGQRALDEAKAAAASE
jgi:GT2 family glycosyltransferase